MMLNGIGDGLGQLKLSNCFYLSYILVRQVEERSILISYLPLLNFIIFQAINQILTAPKFDYQYERQFMEREKQHEIYQ